MTQAQARSLFRELVNESNTTVVPDTTIDLYIQRGLEALNELVGYAFEDDTSITTSAGTQEYTLPSDCIRVEWVEYGTTLLDRLDQEEFRQGGTDWRDTAAGTPTNYYLYGRKLGLYPKPDAATSLRIRMVTTPLDFTANGFDQLADQDHSIPVFYAAAFWCGVHPTEVNIFRTKWLQEEFLRRAALMQKFYETRRLFR